MSDNYFADFPITPKGFYRAPKKYKRKLNDAVAAGKAGKDNPELGMFFDVDDASVDGQYRYGADTIHLNPAVERTEDDWVSLLGHEGTHAQIFHKDTDKDLINAYKSGKLDITAIAASENELFAEAGAIAANLLRHEPWLKTLKKSATDLDTKIRVDKAVDNAINSLLKHSPYLLRSKDLDLNKLRSYVYSNLNRMLRDISKYGDILVQPPKHLIDAASRRGIG